MERQTRYRKPCMTNLPPELGRAIFEQIRNTPAPDVEKMRAESARLVREILDERERKNV